MDVDAMLEVGTSSGSTRVNSPDNASVSCLRGWKAGTVECVERRRDKELVGRRVAGVHFVGVL